LADELEIEHNPKLELGHKGTNIHLRWEFVPRPDKALERSINCTRGCLTSSNTVSRKKNAGVRETRICV
jgi:hypothetical protein